MASAKRLVGKVPTKNWHQLDCNRDEYLNWLKRIIYSVGLFVIVVAISCNYLVNILNWRLKDLRCNSDKRWTWWTHGNSSCSYLSFIGVIPSILKTNYVRRVLRKGYVQEILISVWEQQETNWTYILMCRRKTFINHGEADWLFQGMRNIIVNNYSWVTLFILLFLFTYLIFFPRRSCSIIYVLISVQIFVYSWLLCMSNLQPNLILDLPRVWRGPGTAFTTWHLLAGDQVVVERPVKKTGLLASVPGIFG